MGRFRGTSDATADPASDERSGHYHQSHVGCHRLRGAFRRYKDAHED